VADALFAYGTLAVAEVIEAVAGRAFAAEPARLRGFARRAVRGEVFPALVAAAGAETAGVLYRGLDAEAFAALDAFEGDLYERRAVTVDTAAGSAVADAYLARDARRAALADAAWDLERFVARDLPRYLAACRVFRAEWTRRAGR
jgi:gamma-glutamylcyclotransferase (GGCT)/AIG2-like uncharacterized protein YtfP